jgi:DNA polymerase eta
LAHIVADGRAWPCANLSLSVSGFEDGPSNNRGIGSFLTRGGEVRPLTELGHNDSSLHRLEREEPPEKRRKMDNSRDSTGADTPCNDGDNDKTLSVEQDKGEASDVHDENDELCDIPGTIPPSSHTVGVEKLHQQTIDVYFCSDCNKSMPMESQAEHEDWHFAKDLSKQLQRQARGSQEVSRTTTSNQSTTLPKGRGRFSGKIANAKRIEKGQKTLGFGKG